MSRCPMPRHRTGWFQVAHPSELEPGTARPPKHFGHELVLYRGALGEPVLLDPHCPHMGAHLGHGGRVRDGCVACPFHGWRVDGGGACVDPPLLVEGDSPIGLARVVLEKQGAIPGGEGLGRWSRRPRESRAFAARGRSIPRTSARL
jgi:phenylpropionate dioxygenase-like ring-hydroxylating dioxygenase large terminal subunit